MDAAATDGTKGTLLCVCLLAVSFLYVCLELAPSHAVGAFPWLRHVTFSFGSRRVASQAVRS